MVTVIRQFLLECRNVIGGITSISLANMFSFLPSNITETLFISQTTEIAGVAIPTFLIYYFVNAD